MNVYTMIRLYVVYRFNKYLLMTITGNASATASCDFETDMCGWQHVNTSSAMYWRRQRAPAPRLSNGPLYDHTRRSDQGLSNGLLFCNLVFFSIFVPVCVLRVLHCAALVRNK